MTSAQFMQSVSRRFGICMLAIVAVSVANGCGSRQKLEQPMTLHSPFGRPMLLAVAPFANESGVSTVRADRVADLFTEQLEQVNGIHAVPVNRVLQAMRVLELDAIASQRDVERLIHALGVDGVIVGTVTSYDPYSPLKFGAAVELFVRESPRSSPIPLAQASGVFNASNHDTLRQLDEYSRGRTSPTNAYGKKAYLVSMELYTEFAAHRLIHDLLDIDETRLSAAAGGHNER